MTLFSEYATFPITNDEMLDASGRVAPHWQSFAEQMTTLGPEGIGRLQTEIHRLIRENGVTYNVYDSRGNSLGDAEGPSTENQQRLWALDVMPMIIAEHEWRKIEAGIIQRAELLNLILADLYGPQTLIKERLLPLDLIHRAPGFLRPCHNTMPLGKHQLILYAADLARGPDQRMWVIADHTQAPSGSGYALENRTVMNQVQQAFFQQNAFYPEGQQTGQRQQGGTQAQYDSGSGTKISRLSGYFRDLQSTLARLSPRHPEGHAEPRVVVMTPGPHSETYFEHAYLASYLGYTLVQGDDLSVYSGAVTLKALGGLQPVDTILRRVDDTFCDPLELRSDSYLGVTGMLESVRRQEVAVVNPLGSGLLENLGILPFMQGIATHWLGEELILPTAATWWCGQQEELTYVLDHLDELIIKPISRHFREPAILPEQLSREERANLVATIRAAPHRYVGQQRVSYSTAPTLIDGKLQPRKTILRTFALARQDDYAVMPGGLTRSAKAADDLAVSTSQGGISKDTWVLTQEPQRHVSLWQLQADRTVEAFHSADSLPSRAAENLFWVGRYTERAESSTRLLRTILAFFADGFNLKNDNLNKDNENNDNEFIVLRQLLTTLTQTTMTYPGFVGAEGEEGERALKALLENPLHEVLSVAIDPSKLGSLHSDLRAMSNAAYAVRNLWSVDSWRVLQEIGGPWAALAQEFPLCRNESQAGAEKAVTKEGAPNSSGPNALQPNQRRSAVQLSQQVSRDLNQLITQLMALVGLYNDSMTHNAGWAMLDMGRRLERVLRTTAFIRSALVIKQEPWVENLLLEATLRITDNTITYRRRYRSHLQFKTVLDLLLLDDQNPRSLIWQLDALQKHLEHLPRAKVSYQLSNEEQILVLAKTRLQLCNTAQLLQPEDDSVLRKSLDSLMSELTFNLSELSNVVTQNYFTHSQPKQQFGTARAELLGEM